MIHPLVMTISVWNIIQIKLGSEELWPGHGFWVCVHCDLDLADMTLGQGHDTPLGHEQQLCEILSRSDKLVRSYSLDTMWTDGQTVRRTDRVIPIYPLLWLWGGGIKRESSVIYSKLRQISFFLYFIQNFFQNTVKMSLPQWQCISSHQFFCILHFCHTCSLCRVELVVQFPARGSTRVLLCLFPGVLWLWHFLYSVGPHPVSKLPYIHFRCVAGIHGGCR